MKIKPSVEIENIEGLPIPIVEIKAICPHCKERLDIDEKINTVVTKTDKNITLKSVCVDALYGTYEDEKNLNGMEKQKRGKLADKIYLAKGYIELTPKEVALLQDLIGKMHNTLIVTRAYELLDPVEKEDTPIKSNKKTKASKKSN